MSLTSPRSRIIENVQRNLRLAAYFGEVTKRSGNALHGGSIADDGVRFIRSSIQRNLLLRRRHPRKQPPSKNTTIPTIPTILTPVQSKLPLPIHPIQTSPVHLAPDRVTPAPKHRIPLPQPTEPPSALRSGRRDGGVSIDVSVRVSTEEGGARHGRSEGYHAVGAEVEFLEVGVLIPGGVEFVVWIVDVYFLRVIFSISIVSVR
mmetsp:Transcript_15819/g.34077  ORF Transcript_15819/g.34077 Transcript_15819/m.34077 type:complete len:204 (+) Transcript_15819:2031-2642(+)